MANIIPRPAMSKDADEKIWFSKKPSFGANGQRWLRFLKSATTKNFETRVETMHDYFKSIGINLAPKRIYCGNTFIGADNMTEDKCKEKGSFLWSRNPYYELELLDY